MLLQLRRTLVRKQYHPADAITALAERIATQPGCHEKPQPVSKKPCHSFACKILSRSLTLRAMRIALIHHSDDVTNDYGAYLSTLLEELAEKNNYVIKDYTHITRARETLKSEDVLLHIVIPANKKFALARWYNSKLKGILRKHRIDALVCLYGITANTQIKQLLIFPDSALKQAHKGMLTWQKFAAKKLEKSCKTAEKIITYSNISKTKLEGFEDKTTVIPFTASSLFVPMEWHNRLYIKSRFAENKEYFVAVLPDDNENVFTNLLKAFSKFKKWQQSNMKLLLLPKEEEFSRTIEGKLDYYKYREDVRIINDAERKDIADIVAASYAMLHNPACDSDLWPVAIALQCAIPVIYYKTESTAEYCEDAGYAIEDASFETFGDAMIKLYREEELKTSMGNLSAERSRQYVQEEHATALWQLITGKL